MIRTAKLSDAEQAIQVLRRSITELCIFDHLGNDEIVQMWLENKTPAHFRSWVCAPDQHILVAEHDGTICAVGGAARKSGEITLNYIAPSARFQGISKRMLVALERYLQDAGHEHVILTSTATAHRFYRSVGYVDTGAPVMWGLLSGYPMAKALV
ncbi:GNAT family N-acetyltransferase [Rhizobium sp. BR 362]|uniref:GNAT family N-acetyltransferase n=1 Tax=Rhizobium sp. BR 362 TaxID=3040670 RepID=UPI002F3F45AE